MAAAAGECPRIAYIGRMAEQPAVFLDRDGVINRRIVGGYVRRWEEFEFLPGIMETLPPMHAAGFRTVLVTNQRGIALGLMSEHDLAAIHERMQQALADATGHRIDAIYFCPHDRAGGCACRKPMPGMLLDAARDLDLDLSRSWMIGDSESDIEAGRAAGCRTVLVGHGETRADFTAGSLTAAWELIAGLA